MKPPLQFLKNFFNHPLARLGIACLLLVFVFREVNLYQIWQQLQQAQPGGLILFFFGSLFLAWLAGWRWALILVPRKITATDHWAFFRATMMGLFYNLFMPSSMGGDALKWTALTHLNVSRKSIILTMLIDRLLGLLGLFTVGFVALVCSHTLKIASIPEFYYWMLGMGFAGVLFFLVLISTDWKWRQLPWVGKLTWVSEVENYLELHRQRFWLAFLIGVVVQVVSVAIEFALAKSIGFSVTWMQFLIVWPILGTVIALPINFAGFGATEVGFVYFFSQLGVPAVQTLALTALMAVFRFILGGIGWIVGLTEVKPKL